MKDINSVTLVGRLTRDAELKATSNGKVLCAFSIASTLWKDKSGFFDCSLFGKLAEAVNQYLTKGKQVIIKGSLDYQSWEKDGQKRSKVAIMVDDLQLVGSKSDAAPSQPAQPAPESKQNDWPF
jgi:single-strand DNA-binding protein